MSDFTFIIFIVLAVPLVLLLLSIRIVPEGYQYLLVRLGKKKACLDPGLHFIVPFIEWIHSKVNIRERTMIFDDVPSPTKDNIVLLVSSSMTYKIENSESAIYNVVDVHENLKILSEQLLGSIFRDCLFEDDLLTKIDSRRDEVFQSLIETTDRWGISLNDLGPIQYKLPAELAADIVRLKQVKIESELSDEQNNTKNHQKLLAAESLKKVGLVEEEAQSKRNAIKADTECYEIKAKADAEKYADLQQGEGKRQQHIMIAEGKEREAKAEKVLLEHIRETTSVLENASADRKVFILPVAGAHVRDELMKAGVSLDSSDFIVDSQDKLAEIYQDESGSSGIYDNADSGKGEVVKPGFLDTSVNSMQPKIRRPVDPEVADKKIRSLIGTDNGDETFIGLQVIDKNSLSKLEESMTYACDDTQDL